MIKLYGNEIWNSNTPNQYKKVIIASESQFESITDALENAGLNYCGYINKNKSYVAVGRATVPNLEKLNISYDSIVDSNNRKYVTNNIIGTTKYNDIGDKMYRKYNTDFAYKVAQRLSEQDIPFSGRIFGKNTTITVDNIYKDAINAIAHEIREQRELLYNDKAVEKNEPSATVKNSVTVSKEDNTENLFNALSVLHYKAHQLESLNSTVELLNNHPELIDTFSTMFEDTSDFKPEQLNMLSMNFVKTYSGLSDSELILANTADFNEIKQSFINTNLAYKLIENHGYSYAQSELIRDMVDMGIDYDTINLLDYTFSLTEMQTFIGAYSRSDYDSLINLVSKVKGVTRSEVEGMISDGTYTPALPDFNTLEKTLYFQESEAESITYMYYNPDAYSGGQFVITEVSYKQIAEANKEYGDDFSGFFDFLDTTGEQRLIDIGSESFRTAVKKFYSGTEFAEGLNADIQHKLVELAVVPEIKLPEVRKIELIKVGDFYEVRGENAKTVADILDLVSTTRNINGSSVDTVGFPDFKLNDNTELLKTQGFTVNIKYEGLVDLSNEFNKLISEQKKITSNVSDKHTIVINAFAGPGAGKTTSCLEVAEKLKKQGFVTEYVQEYAKELVYDNNLIMLDGHYEHQFAILNEQMKRINRLYGKVDFIVTDSPILLNNTYLNEDKNTEVYLAYSDSVNKLYGLYNNFNYFVERDTSVFEKEGRIHNLEQSIAIDNELKNMLHNNQIDFDVYTHATIDNIVRDSTIIYAKQLINSYCQDEFDSEADFSDLKKVGVAYTTTEDSKHTVEAVVNLVDYRLETYVDDKLFKEETYADLKDMIDNCLHSLSFDDLVYLSDEELAPFYEEHDELDDVDPAVIRQQLEDAGIVNGELVDEDKLNSDPFIQQVMADAETDAERNFYQNNFDIKVRNYAGALKVSSEEIVNQFNSESEAVPVNEPEQGNIRPTITCDWSESPVFENGKTYSVSEFDTLMKNADDEWVEQRQLEIEEYGSENAVAEAYRNGELDNIHLGYEKTKFIVNMPNGTTHTFRQAIGDGDGGVIDFLKQYPQYSGVVKILEADIKLDKGENEKAADLPITESKEREVRSDEKLQSVDELAVEVENAAPSRAEKAEVTVVNKAEPPTLFDMVESSEQTETSVNDEKAKNYVIEDREAVTGAKTKFQNNIAAIKILKQTEAENRAATPEEQGQLSLYSGWGGLANAFESDNDKWKNEYSELKGLLTDEEYTAARSTVLDSFYTDTAIVDSIYEVIRNAGFEDGNILEPAMGVGNFFGRLPEELRDKVNLYGVEKDSLSGRIAQKLYPQADITIDGFENTRFNDNSFDVAIGNIPFGDFSVNDSKYNSEHLKIHDYFFLKSLDKVRDGGIVAFVTSKGTLDKKDSSFRKTLAERADLVGAVRLPNNAFKSAGTEVTADIIFLQKREKKSEIEPSWVHTGQLENGLTVNNYFVEHPEMILGEVVEGNKMFGRTDDTMCVPFNDGRTLSELLSSAVKNINFEYSASAEKLIPVSEHLTAEPLKLRLQSFYRRNGEIYFYGSDKSGKIVNVSADKALGKKLNHERINSFIDIRDTLRELLDVQQYDNKDSEIAQLQEKLNNCYDSFYSKYGLLHSSYNHSLLNSDGAYPLVASLEADFAKDNNLLVKKSDIFTERVNKPTATISHVDTAEEALAVCVAEKGVIDFEYMSQITDVPPEDLKIGLREKGEIFAVPSYTGDEDYEYQTASEYLSGDIYAKLDMAKAYASVNGIYESNVVALKEVLPTPLKAGDIDINLGATWIDKKYYEQFMYEVFETPQSLKSDYVSRFFKSDRIELDYSEYSGRWNITNKRADLSVTTVKPYGASGLSAYQIFESVLNLSEPKVYKDKVDEYGVVERDKNNKPVRVLDVEATQVVQQKANAIRREFKNWIFKDANRRRDIVDTYNRTFNCVHAREYDGSHLNFPGMNSNIQLHEHQKNAIAHAIYGGNTLFAHSVGAGKTFEMIATAMECKRLGLCHKSLFAVPNHLTEQVGADFLKLYPNANILVATKDDFKSSNRKMLMSKIATGNYDAVIIGHTQLKMLPLSPERQEAFLQSQIDDIVAGLAEMKAQDGNKFTVKEMERTKKNLENQLEKLQSSKKDNTVYFEELGIDKLFVDEAHEFKNLYCATKLQNVSGISSRASQRATELFAKCRYLDEKTGGKGVVFATGTPLSNSVTELHTMMRYLNYDFLASHNNMQNFDNWISAFGVQKKEYELAPAGNKFKERTRIAEYSNLPELMSMFKMVADVKTAETLKLKVPDCELHIVDVEPTELQKELVDELSDRADEVNSGSVDPSQDNMLKITGDGRKLGLDPRLISPDFEDDPNTKLNVCVNNVFDIYTDTAKDKLTQIVFCDLGVPSKNTGNDSSKEQNDNKSVAELDSLEETGKFCVYDDIRDKLIAKGIPATEIAYIHNAKTEAQKSELFSKVRSGEVRILLGSTGKMGTGTNVQDRIIALHDLDVPWRPADLEQRRGRMVRQGNINEKVHLYRYVTKGTFDAYSYQLLETKQKFISQVMTDKAPARKCADVDQAALSYGEIKALCTGDDRIREKLTLDNRVKELNSLKADYNNTKYELEDTVAAYPEKRKQLLCTIGNIKSDIDNVKSFVDKDGKLICKLTLGSQTFNLKNDEERKNAAKALTTAVAQVRIADNRKKQVSVGNICGFDISVINNGNVYDDIVVTIKGKYSYSAQLGVSAVHNLSKIEGLLYKTESVLDYSQNSLNKLDLDYKTSVALLEKPFEYEAELQEKSARLSELTKILNIELAHQKTESKPKTHYFGKDKILGRNKSSKQVQNKTVMKSEPKRSEPEL
jgi:N12 class adenine-specific DNA methylase